MPLGFPKAIFSGSSANNETVIDFDGIFTSGTSVDIHMNINIIKDDLNIVAGGEHFGAQTSAGAYKVSNDANDTATLNDAPWVPLKAGTYQLEITTIDGNFTHDDSWDGTILIVAGAVLNVSGTPNLFNPPYTAPGLSIAVSKGAGADPTFGNVVFNNFTESPSSPQSSSFPLVLGKALYGGALTDHSNITSISYVGDRTEPFKTNFGLFATFVITGGGVPQQGAGRVRLTFRNA